jgi:hypothetical protein
MTRTRSGSLGGVAPTDADVDQEIFTRCLLQVAQDLNMVYDMVTGANTPGAPPVIPTMKHDGSAQGGSLLAIPVVNTVINQKLIGMSETDSATFGTDIYIACCPIFVAAGEAFFALEVDANEETLALMCEIYDSTGALITAPLPMDFDAARGTWCAFPQFSVLGVVYYLAVRATVLAASHCSLNAVRMWPTSGGADAPYVDVDAQAPDGSPQPVPTAAAGAAMQFETIHDQMIADNFATAGWVLNTLNRNINALWEALTGAPVDGNTAVTNADSGSTNPATSRFIAHSRAGADLANEPLIDFPILSEPVGAVRGDGNFVVENADPPVTGMTAWFAPYPRAAGGTTDVLHRCRVYLPDFPNGGSSNMKVTLMFASSGKGTPTNWQARINSVTAGVTTAFAAVARLGATIFYAVTFSGVDFTPDFAELLQVEVKSAGAFTFEELAFVGWSVYFDP